MTSLLLALAAIPTLPAMQFQDRPGKIYVIARSASRLLGWKLEHDPVTNLTVIDGKPIPVEQPTLFDGSLLLESKELPQERIKLTVGKPRVVADLTNQTLTAWQGDLVVMRTAISSGRDLKDTPPGNYLTGMKETMHISSIYGSKMPFSVHLKGNYFIHGSEQTQTGPGSHGCVRLPMYNNAAEWFFRWVAPGTPVRVHGKRQNPSKVSPSPPLAHR